VRDALEALRRGSRILVGAARDGFTDTASVQEFYRDLGGRWPDRYATFVWEESVQVDGDALLLMADVCPETTAVPEILDAVRLLSGWTGSVAECRARTDAGLRIRTRWQDFKREETRG
jgi:hypothetical protein